MTVGVRPGGHLGGQRGIAPGGMSGCMSGGESGSAPGGRPGGRSGMTTGAVRCCFRCVSLCADRHPTNHVERGQRYDLLPRWREDVSVWRGEHVGSDWPRNCSLDRRLRSQMCADHTGVRCGYRDSRRHWRWRIAHRADRHLRCRPQRCSGRHRGSQLHHYRGVGVARCGVFDLDH